MPRTADDLATTLYEAIANFEWHKHARWAAEQLDEMIGEYVRKGELSRDEGRDLRGRYQLHARLA